MVAECHVEGLLYWDMLLLFSYLPMSLLLWHCCFMAAGSVSMQSGVINSCPLPLCAAYCHTMPDSDMATLHEMQTLEALCNWQCTYEDFINTEPVQTFPDG